MIAVYISFVIEAFFVVNYCDECGACLFKEWKYIYEY